MNGTRIKRKCLAANGLSLLLVATLFCRPAFCGEIHDAAGEGDLEKVKALLTKVVLILFSVKTTSA